MNATERVWFVCTNAVQIGSERDRKPMLAEPCILLSQCESECYYTAWIMSITDMTERDMQSHM